MADHLTVDRKGGFAGFGGPAKIRSVGRVDLDTLSQNDRDEIERLFDRFRGATEPFAADAFRYTISRSRNGHTETVTVPENILPAAVVSAVEDTLL